MLITYIIDGDKGGVGKSLAARALVHHLITLRPAERPAVFVFDADLSNPDLCGEGGLRESELIELATLIDLSTEDGWIDFATRISMIGARAQRQPGREFRAIVSMPAQIGTRAFDGSIPIVAEVLREANAMPVWMLSRTQESLRALSYRIRNLRERYEVGVIVKNLFFGAAEKFLLWEMDPLRLELVEGGGWSETRLPELNDQITVLVGRRPFHEVLANGIDGRALDLGVRLALQSWLNRTSASFATAVTSMKPEYESAGDEAQA